MGENKGRRLPASVRKNMEQLQRAYSHLELWAPPQSPPALLWEAAEVFRVAPGLEGVTN